MNKKNIIMLAGILAVALSACAPRVDYAAILDEAGKNATDEVSDEAGEEVSENEEATEEAETEEVAEDEPVVEVPKNAMEAYYRFLGLVDEPTISAVVDNDVEFTGVDDDENHGGEYFTLDELTEYMSGHRVLGSEKNPKAVPTFAFMDAKDNTLLAVKYESMCIWMPEDDSSVTCIFNYIDGELHLTYAYHSAEKNRNALKSRGYLKNEGYSGISRTYSVRGCIDERGKYNQVFMDYVLIADSCSELNRHLENDIDLNEVYNEFYSGNESPSMSMHVCNVGDEVFVYVDKADQIEETDSRYLKKLEECGVPFADAEYYLSVVQRFDGDSSEYDWQPPIIFNPIKKQNDPIIPAKSFGDTSSWNYEEMVHSELNPNKEAEMLEITKHLSGEVVDSILDAVDELNKPDGDKFVLVAKTGTSGKDDYFRLYMSDDGRSIVVTPDDQVVVFDFVLCDYIYETAPELKVADIDSDGDKDLLMKTSMFHGTGFYQQGAIVVENSGNSSWLAFHLTPQQYISLVGEYLTYTDKGDVIGVVVSDVESGTFSKNDIEGKMNIFLDNFVDIELGDDYIGLGTKPMVYASEMPFGYQLGAASLTLQYEGSGQWTVRDFEYSDINDGE